MKKNCYKKLFFTLFNYLFISALYAQEAVKKVDDGKKEPESVNFRQLLNKKKDLGQLRGNFIYKNDWLKIAAQAHTELLSLHAEILDLKKNSFDSKAAQIQKSMQDFSDSMTGSQGSLSAMFLQVQVDIDDKLDILRESAKAADINTSKVETRYQIYDAEEKMSKYKDEIDQLRMSVASVEDLEKQFLQRVSALDDYIKKIDEILANSEDKLEMLFDVVDHERARTTAYEISGLRDQMRAVKEFIAGDVLKSFDTEQKTLASEIDRLNKQINDLKQKISQIDMEAAKKFLADYKASMASGDSESAQDKQAREERAAARAKNKASEGSGGIIYWITFPFKFFVSLITSLFF